MPDRPAQSSSESTDAARARGSVEPVAAEDETSERRTLIWAAVGFFGVLLVLIGATVLFSGDSGDQRETPVTTEACAPDDAACEATGEAVVRPGIIPEPGSGRAPEDEGDPGGALQIAVFVLIVAGLATIIGLVVRSSRKARRAREAEASGTTTSP